MYNFGLPRSTWEKAATDIFELDGNNYFLIADYYKHSLK